MRRRPPTTASRPAPSVTTLGKYAVTFNLNLRQWRGRGGRGHAGEHRAGLVVGALRGCHRGRWHVWIQREVHGKALHEDALPAGGPRADLHSGPIPQRGQADGAVCQAGADGQAAADVVLPTEAQGPQAPPPSKSSSSWVKRLPCRSWRPRLCCSTRCHTHTHTARSYCPAAALAEGLAARRPCPGFLPRRSTGGTMTRIRLCCLRRHQCSSREWCTG